MTEEGDASRRGLSQAEAAQRLAAEGPNELPQAARRTLWRIALEVAREPMFQLLVAAGALYLVMGDGGEAAMLLAFVVMTMAITITQEQRTERVLEALRDLTSPRALVLRGGERVRIAGREVVRGDLLLLADGDRVAADGWLLEANDLRVDESLLTGESVPVDKRVAVAGPSDAAPQARPKAQAGTTAEAGPGADAGDGSDAAGRVYAGTLVVGGQGLAEVRATGARSEIGRIGLSLRTIDASISPLARQTRQWVRGFSALGLAVSLAATLIHGLMRGDWVAALLAGITLAMSMLPQEFLLILTVFMAMGAWRMARQQVLARRANSIETLGACTVLCTDKTGTLTLNRMQVAELRSAAGGVARFAAGVDGEAGEEIGGEDGVGLDGADARRDAGLDALLRAATLASERDAVDPMERALHALAARRLREPPAPAGATLVDEYGLSAELPAMTHVWQLPGQADRQAAIKGAPEAVLALCRLAPDLQAEALAQAQAMARQGQRVLAVAQARHGGSPRPDTPAGFEWHYLGLVGLSDPLRPSVPAAVRECRAAGIRLAMITGDHGATALAIAEAAGLDVSAGVVTGPELAALDEAGWQAVVQRCNVFARVRPEQKLRLVEVLQAQGQVVGMTGDGVNDAPSLKAAHIGIAMGARGTDVAREAASLVLLDDDFGAIVHAVRLGRRIDDNLRKAMAFVLAVHGPIAGLTLMPLLLGWPLVFMPVHIAFLELLIDPVCSIVFEAESEEHDVMQRPPRDPRAPLLSMSLLVFSLIQGALVLAVIGVFHAAMTLQGVPPAAARAATFTALVAANVALILVNRSLGGRLWRALTRPNPLLGRLLLATLALWAVVLVVPVVRQLFAFDPVEPAWLAAGLGLCVVLLPLLHALRRLERAWLQRR